ncbi:A/G-specific adenine glycosylase [Pseudoblastomonas halimionae]|uniref:Adenine DNA glycosylase n=1 Tax=Alteriqipengyuania halimionae TaxID=1926630 RepID=A0A6I4U6L7_9SPHN|nr:A/G-specific adenine glycosylase [Alteriqipengyuania halimionae]MXP10071.1 A/G-specific adenine glycosylase [Alteriqipengyuania halimionae]
MTSSPIATLLLDWYADHARVLPWRVPPGGEAPADHVYRVWLSEVMLQQTTVAAVRPRFEAWVERWPSAADLAAASEEQVMAAWAGLGYYARARNLVKAAREVAGRGGFPTTEAELRELPGLGDYTAAAIAAIGFGEDAVPVDANVERVVARLFAIDEPLPKARKAIRENARAVWPRGRAGDFAQAMMDLGSSICTARDPKCLLCPLRAHCAGYAMGEPERLPVKPPKKAKPDIRGTAWWIERDGQVWLVRRPAKGMMGRMRALPDDGWTARADGSGPAPLAGEWQDVGAIEHTFTHARLTLTVKRLEPREEPSGEGEWWPIARLDHAGLPTLFAKAATRAKAAID